MEKNEENEFLEIYLSIIENEKKKKLECKPFLGYCPSNIVKKKNILYCKVPIVLQPLLCSG